MRSGPQPDGAAGLQAQVRQSAGRDEAAVGHVPGETRPVVAEQRLPDGRMDAVGADHHVRGRPRPVGEHDLRPLPARFDPHAAPPDLHKVRRHGARIERR